MATQYEKISIIGSGTFGKVWLVRHSATGRRYVIKEVSVVNMTEKSRAQTLTEVEVLARCRHINVVRYRETFIHEGLLCIAMSYAEGGDLHAKIQNQRGISFEEPVILDWFVQICFALRYIHGMNILHRDLKTHNIFLSGGNIIKIGDFGIARVLSDTNDLASTAVGTPYYLSPEICQQEPYNCKSDMWAAGCVLYELCCLRPPFDGHSFAALVIRILNGTYERIPTQYSSTLEDLVSVLLRSDATSRPSADQVLWVPALQDYVKGHVVRTAALNKQRQLSPAPAMQRQQEIKGSDEKENIDPALGKQRPRRRSLATPRSDAMQKIENKRAVNSAEGYRKTSRKIKESGAPTLSLYKEVLRRSIKRSPQLHHRQDRAVMPLEKTNKLVSRTYKIHRDIGVNPGRQRRMGRKYEGLMSPAKGEVKKDPSKRTIPSTQSAPSLDSADEAHQSLENQEVSRENYNSSKVILGTPEEALNSETEEGLKIQDSSQKLKVQSNKDGSSCVESSGSMFLSSFETVQMLYSNFCKNQDSAYPLMEDLRSSLEASLGPDQLSFFHKSVRNALKDGLPLKACMKDLNDRQITEMPRLLHLLQLEAIADI